MTLTIKQLEAFRWVARLGSVVEAAARLNLAQSTVSKRILELEAILGVELFDRSRRAVTTTRNGVNLLSIAEEMMMLEARARRISADPLAFSGVFRFGITELVALTWLSKLIVALRETYPNVVPEPEVEASVTLFERLADHRLDLVIGLAPPPSAEFRAIPLDHVELQWMSAPGVGPEGDEATLEEIARFPLLTQAEGSGLQKLVLDWLSLNGIGFNRIVKCNSLSVLSALAAAGLGITFLTGSYFLPEIESGKLRVIRSTPKIPPIQYFAVYRADNVDLLVPHVAQTAQACCDFSLREMPIRPALPI